MVIRVPVFRHVETGTDGRFSIPVKPGLWEVQVVRRGFVLREEILPITIESEGDYELNVMLIADNEPPIIVHQPSGGYTFGEPMIVEAQVTDNHEVRGVAVRLFREFVEDTVIFAEGKMDVEGEIGSAEAGADLEIGSDAPPPPVTPVKEEEGAEVEPARPQILDPSFSPIFDDAIDVPIDLKPPRPGYFAYIPMETADGTNYRVDLRHHLGGPFPKNIESIRYIIQAIDVASGYAVSPENASEAMYTVPLTIPQTISGTVTVNGRPLAGLTINFSDRETLRLFTLTDADGSYQIPAVVGMNIVAISFSFGHQIVFPERGFHEVNVQAGGHVEGIDFRLKALQSEPPVPFATGRAEAIRRTVEDLNGDAAVDIFDLTLIGLNFGKKIEQAAAAGASLEANPDVNGDGVVNIIDLVLVAKRFGEKLAKGAPSPPIRTIDVQMEAILLNRTRATATLALKLETDVDVRGVQFDLALDSDKVKLLAVEKGDLLDTDESQSFWHQPELQRNLARGIANVALGAKAKAKFSHASGQLAIITLQLDGASFGDRAEIRIENLLLVDADGRGVLTRTQPIPLDLESLIQPEQDLLLQNYPNPFNPETWIPYQITQDATVRIDIYNTLGQVVRTLDLGHRPVGVYVSRGRAAYWDGTNNFGERVASSVYFYAIKAGSFHAVKRMVILK
jgi:hypothetical protein